MSWHLHDPVMTRLVETIPAPPPSVRNDLYLALLESVVSQQLSVRVADVIFARFCGLFADNYPEAAQVLALETDVLRSVGLSGQKAAYIRNIAAFHLANPVTMERLDHLTDEEVIAELTQIKGVGRWTVQMLLMFPMNRPDIFPIDDLGIRQSMIALYGVTETGKDLYKRLHQIADAWQPHRTLACKYLWRARDGKTV
jgi:DNA-3-methyladenine glycosylase II